MSYVDKDGNTFMHLAVMTTATTISAGSEELRRTEELSDKKSVRFSVDEKQHVLENIIKGLFNLDNMIIVKENKQSRTPFTCR
jgi:hypothetical protein